MGRRGLSLIEVVVAALILAVVAAGIMGVFVSGKQFARGSDDRLRALGYAQEKLEELHRAVTTDPLRSAPLAAGSHPAQPENLGDGFERSYQVRDILDVGGSVMYKKVTVTVEWPDDPVPAGN